MMKEKINEKKSTDLLIPEKSIVETRKYGKMIYQGEEGEKMTFIKRGNLDDIINVRVEEKDIVFDDRIVNFNEESCYNINKYILPLSYQLKNKILEKSGL